jgi:hypothetical protein
MADVQGGECLSCAHWLGTWRVHSDLTNLCESWHGGSYAFLAESAFCNAPYFEVCCLIPDGFTCQE